MLDWLRKSPRDEPVLELHGRNVPIAIRRLANAKRMTLRLAPDGSEVRLSIPRWCRTADAVSFAVSRQDWLATQLARVPVAAPVEHGGAVRFRGDDLIIRHDPSAPRRVRIVEEELHIGGATESLTPRLRRWLEGEARQSLTDDLEYYCAKAGLPIAKLSLSNAQRRWGSCSASGAIRINWRLIMAPDTVRRSVVAHEVTHLVHFDHSPRFYAFLRDIFEHDLAAADHWLKHKGRSLYSVFP